MDNGNRPRPSNIICSACSGSSIDQTVSGTLHRPCVILTSASFHDAVSDIHSIIFTAFGAGSESWCRLTLRISAHILQPSQQRFWYGVHEDSSRSFERGSDDPFCSSAGSRWSGLCHQRRLLFGDICGGEGLWCLRKQYF